MKVLILLIFALVITDIGSGGPIDTEVSESSPGIRLINSLNNRIKQSIQRILEGTKAATDRADSLQNEDRLKEKAQIEQLIHPLGESRTRRAFAGQQYDYDYPNDIKLDILPSSKILEDGNKLDIDYVFHSLGESENDDNNMLEIFKVTDGVANDLFSDNNRKKRNTNTNKHKSHVHHAASKCQQPECIQNYFDDKAEDAEHAKNENDSEYDDDDDDDAEKRSNSFEDINDEENDNYDDEIDTQEQFGTTEIKKESYDTDDNKKDFTVHSRLDTETDNINNGMVESGGKNEHGKSEAEQMYPDLLTEIKQIRITSGISKHGVHNCQCECTHKHSQHRQSVDNQAKIPSQVETLLNSIAKRKRETRLTDEAPDYQPESIDYLPETDEIKMLKPEIIKPKSFSSDESSNYKIDESQTSVSTNNDVDVDFNRQKHIKRIDFRNNQSGYDDVPRRRPENNIEAEVNTPNKMSTKIEHLGGIPNGPIALEESLEKNFLNSFSNNAKETISWKEPDIRDNCWAQAMLGTERSFSPSCNADGSFGPKQCFLERCWCTASDGTPQEMEPDKRFYYSVSALMLQCSHNP